MFNLFYCIYNYFTSFDFLMLALAVFILFLFYWTLSDKQLSYVFTPLQSILTNLNNAVIRMVTIVPSIASISNLSWSLETIPSALSTIGITVIHMFHCFFFGGGLFCFFVYIKVQVLSIIFTSWSTGTAKSNSQKVIFFLLVGTKYQKS